MDRMITSICSSLITKGGQRVKWIPRVWTDPVPMYVRTPLEAISVNILLEPPFLRGVRLLGGLFFEELDAVEGAPVLRHRYGGLDLGVVGGEPSPGTLRGVAGKGRGGLYIAGTLDECVELQRVYADLGVSLFPERAILRL